MGDIPHILETRVSIIPPEELLRRSEESWRAKGLTLEDVDRKIAKYVSAYKRMVGATDQPLEVNNPLYGNFATLRFTVDRP